MLPDNVHFFPPSWQEWLASHALSSTTAVLLSVMHFWHVHSQLAPTCSVVPPQVQILGCAGRPQWRSEPWWPEVLGKRNNDAYRCKCGGRGMSRGSAKIKHRMVRVTVSQSFGNTSGMFQYVRSPGANEQWYLSEERKERHRLLWHHRARCCVRSVFTVVLRIGRRLMEHF